MRLVDNIKVDNINVGCVKVNVLLIFFFFCLCLSVPFRDSVLTKLLKNALGGNSKTIMVRF